MMDAVRRDQIPSFYFMQYEVTSWSVKNLLLIPHFAFPPSAIIKRKPLAPAARRAGWVGCNIALNRIPAEARISVVEEGTVAAEEAVRRQFQNVKPLKKIPIAQRGWTLDMLNAVRSLRTPTFSTRDAYSLVPVLQALHPGNRHVREKLRQQLQVLRDAGFLIQTGRGGWRLAESE
jgi:type II restriction enzyme